MRVKLMLAAAVAALGFGFSQPAAAGGWDRGYYGTVYIHHHVYYPSRYRHVYHVHTPGPRHVHMIHHAGYPKHYRGSGYFAPARYYWPWRGHRWHW